MTRRTDSDVAGRSARKPKIPRFGAIPRPITEAMFTIAVVALAFGCGPRVKPEGPGAGPDGAQEDPKSASAGAENPKDAANRAQKPQGRPPAREMLIGEMCPLGAAGRPAVMPLFSRTVIWSDDDDEVAMPLERQKARQFSVLAWDGRRAGVFSVAGTADVGLERRAAIGAYAGDSPCKRASKPTSGRDAGTNPVCVAAQADCGLALAVIERNARPFDEDPDPTDISVAGACVADDKLLVDIDGDGVEEAYPASAFLDPVRAPAEEVTAVSRGSAKCKPAFATRNVIPPADPKHWQGLDVLGVVDIDGDKRREIIVSYHYSERRTWAVYSAISTVGRLDLVGEAVPWPTR